MDAKVLTDELGHSFTGFNEYRGEHEAVAEATAYITLKHFGLDSSERSVPYIAGWLKDRDRFLEVIGAVQSSSHAIITRVEARAGIAVGSLHRKCRC